MIYSVTFEQTHIPYDTWLIFQGAFGEDNIKIYVAVNGAARIVLHKIRSEAVITKFLLTFNVKCTFELISK